MRSKFLATPLTSSHIHSGNGTDGTPVTCSEAAAEGQTTTYQEWEFIKIGENGYYKCVLRSSLNALLALIL